MSVSVSIIALLAIVVTVMLIRLSSRHDYDSAGWISVLVDLGATLALLSSLFFVRHHLMKTPLIASLVFSALAATFLLMWLSPGTDPAGAPRMSLFTFVGVALTLLGVLLLAWGDLTWGY